VGFVHNNPEEKPKELRVVGEEKERERDPFLLLLRVTLQYYFKQTVRNFEKFFSQSFEK